MNRQEFVRGYLGPIDIEKGEESLSIAKKVLEIEHEIYAKSIRLFCDDKVYWENNKPLIKE